MAVNLTFLIFRETKERRDFELCFLKIVHRRGHLGEIK